MAELNNIKRLRETLEEYAKIEVPDDLDPWAKMHSRLVGITPSTGKIESARLDADKKLSSARRRGERRMLRPGFSMLPIMIVGVTLLMLGVFAATRVAEPGASKGYEFVPVGMVRHLVVNSRQVGLGPDPEKSDVGAPITSTIEVWFANAPKDYLIRTHFAHYNGPGEPKISEGWELNDMLYIADPEEKIVLWQSWPYPSVYAPNPDFLSNWLQQPNARIISDTVMDGRPMTVIEVDSGTDEKNQRWVDKETNRVLQWRDITTDSINTAKVTVDELLDANTLAPDFFEFKLPEGYTLQERILPSTLIPVASPTKTSP